MSIYLDYNASTPIDDRVLDSMIGIYKRTIGNADSRTHSHGEIAKNVVENARKQVAALLDITPGEVFFTSGATESNNIALQGLVNYAAKTGKKHIITTSIEHKSILETANAMGKKGYEIEFVDPDITGRISIDQVIDRVREDTLLVSIMHVNNETGTIQPVEEIGQLLAERDVLFHVDATQSCGKLVREISNMKYSMLSFSAHKIQGPQGVGVLVLKKKGYRLPPVKGIMYGGQQEHEIRPGTIPVALVAGCGCACENALHEYEINKKKNIELKKRVIDVLNESGIEYYFNGNQQYCIDNTVNICIPGVNSEALMIMSKQYCSISNGSACNSKNYSPSYVLKAMGMKETDIECSIRISWGPDTSQIELEKNLYSMIEIAKQMKN